MRHIPQHGPRQLLLDALFVVWLSYAALSGQIVPPDLADLLRRDPPAVVVTEPHTPDAPAIQVGETLIPET